MKITLDAKALTVGDMEDFEDAAGVGLMETFGKIDQAGDLSGLRMKTVRALVWVITRQENPDFTFEDARSIRFDELEIEVAGAEPDPTHGDD